MDFLFIVIVLFVISFLILRFIRWEINLKQDFLFLPKNEFQLKHPQVSILFKENKLL